MTDVDLPHGLMGVVRKEAPYQSRRTLPGVFCSEKERVVSVRRSATATAAKQEIQQGRLRTTCHLNTGHVVASRVCWSDERVAPLQS